MPLDSDAKENILRIEQQARAEFRVERGEVESRMRNQQQVAVDTAITNAKQIERDENEDLKCEVVRLTSLLKSVGALN
jgi:hypothetical protein